MEQGIGIRHVALSTCFIIQYDNVQTSILKDYHHHDVFDSPMYSEPQIPAVDDVDGPSMVDQELFV